MLVNHETLQQLTGYSRPADIALCLDKQGVKYFIGSRGRVWTTQEALNAALGLPIQPIMQITAEPAQDKKRKFIF